MHRISAAVTYPILTFHLQMQNMATEVYCTTLIEICSLHMCSFQFINNVTTATNKQHIHIQMVYLLWIHYLFSNLPGLRPCPIDMEGRDGYGFNTNNTDMLKDPWQELASQHKLFCTNKRLLCDTYPLFVDYTCEI
jgi:hypothetical protein